MTRAVEPSLREYRRPKKAPDGGVRVPRVSGGRPGGGGRGPVGAAVVKVVGWRSSASGTRSTLAYVLRKADCAVDDFEQPLTTASAVVEAWDLRDDDGRTAVHLVFSLPNQDPATEWIAAREAAQALFHDHPYVCALHTDTEHPHVHVIVRARDYHGRKLRHDRQTPGRYREALARAGRERGVRVEARSYDVPTRWRDRQRSIGEPESPTRVLDRACAVLRQPAEATPTQLARSVRAVREHQAALATPHRAALVSASSRFEEHPRLRPHARALVKLALSGERSRRFQERRKRNEAVTLAAAKADRARVSVDRVAEPARAQAPSPPDLAVAERDRTDRARDALSPEAVSDRRTRERGPVGSRARAQLVTEADAHRAAGEIREAKALEALAYAGRMGERFRRAHALDVLEAAAGLGRSPTTEPTAERVVRATEDTLGGVAELDQGARNRVRQAADALAQRPAHGSRAARLHAALANTQTPWERSREAIENALTQIEDAGSCSSRVIRDASSVLRENADALDRSDRARIAAATQALAREVRERRDRKNERALEALTRSTAGARTPREQREHAARVAALAPIRSQRALAMLRRDLTRVTAHHEDTAAWHGSVRRAAHTLARHSAHVGDDHRYVLAVAATRRALSPEPRRQAQARALEQLLCHDAAGRAYWERWTARRPALPARVEDADPAQLRHAARQLSAWLCLDADPTPHTAPARALVRHLTEHGPLTQTAERLVMHVDRVEAHERAVATIERTTTTIERPSSQAAQEQRRAFAVVDKDASKLSPTHRVRLADALGAHIDRLGAALAVPTTARQAAAHIEIIRERCVGASYLPRSHRERLQSVCMTARTRQRADRRPSRAPPRAVA